MIKLIFMSLFILINLQNINSKIITVENLNKIGLQKFENFGKLENKVLIMIEELKNRMCHEIPKLKLPVLDAFKLPSIGLNLIPSLEIDLKNIEIDGLSNVEIKDLKISVLLLQFKGKIELNNLSLKTEYKVKGSIPNLMDIDGEGDIHLVVSPVIEFMIKINAGTETPQKLAIKFLTLNPTIKIDHFTITGLFPDDYLNKFVEKLVKNMGAELLGDVWDESKDVLTELLGMLASGPIENKTVKDIIALITSDEPIFDETDPKPDCKDPKFLEKIMPNVQLLAN